MVRCITTTKADLQLCRFNSNTFALANFLTNRFLAKIANNNCMNSHEDRISTSAKLQFYLRNKKSLPKKYSAILSTASLLSLVKIIIIKGILKQKISLQNTFHFLLCISFRDLTTLFSIFIAMVQQWKQISNQILI